MSLRPRPALPIALIAALLLPAGAQAARAPASATIQACAADHMTVVGRVVMTGAAAHKVRGAHLQMRFEALALFGLPQSGVWRDLGAKTKGSNQQVFTGLGFGNWVGVMDWRFTKGHKTVASGEERSQPVRIGGAGGIANCTLAEGMKPVDKTPPQLYILPADGNWHHAPTTVQLLAKDDFSGVKSVSYSVDGGPATPIQNGGSFTITGEGAHTVDWSATDVAGNTASREATVKVDANPPTAAVIQKPTSVTVNRTPTFQWSASTDSGSGLRGYVLTIIRPDGSVVSSTPVDPSTTSLQSPTTLDDNTTYTAIVTAVDNTVDPAWTSNSPTYTFKVDTHPDASSPQDQQVLAFGAKQQPIVVTFDRSLDPTTLGGITVTRDSSAGTSTGLGAPQCASPCNSVSMTPTDQSNGLGEGRYTVNVDVKSDEGVPIQATFHFAVPSSSNEVSSLSTSTSCTLLPPTQAFTLTTTSGAETGLVSFVYSVPSGTVGQVSVSQGSPTLATSAPLDSAGSGTRQTLSFSLAGATAHALTMKYCTTSGGGTLSLSNIWASRAP